MALSVGNVGDNPFQPGVTAETYLPDQLIAGNLKLVTKTVTITGAAALVRGSALGQVLFGTVVSAAKGGGNTGNGTCVPDVTEPKLANVQAGVYKLICTVAGANAATFRLYDPKGRVLKDYSFSGAGASFTTDDQVKTVVTDGATDFAVGDEFDLTVQDFSTVDKYKLSASASVDGSQTPCAVLVDAADASGGDVTGGIYQMGEFNSNAMTFGTGWTATTAAPLLRPFGIFLKSVVSAADPT